MAAASSGTLTDAQIAAFAKSAGFSDSEIPTMVAIARAESGGNPRAHNGNAATGDNSYGLWQINMIGQMGPERRRAIGISSNEQLFDPATNARAARLIYRQQGYAAWSVYKSGSYKKYLNGSDASASLSTGDGSDASAGLIGNAVSAVTSKSIDQLTEKLRLAAVTYVVFLVALVLLILGVIILNKDRIGGVAKTALDIAPQGKAVKIAKKVL